MRAALANHNSLDFRPASPAWPAGSPKNHQFIPVAPLVFGDRIEIGFSGPGEVPRFFNPRFSTLGIAR